MRQPTRTTATVTVAAAVGAALAVTTATTATGAGTPARAGSSTARTAAGAATAGLPVVPLPRPRDFRARVSNPYFPLTPGTRWVYVGRGAEAGERNSVTVLHRTTTIEGIEATVLHDVVKVGGELTEDTYDWYAEDRLGNVWYLGERTKELEHGQVVSREGSWRAGTDGASAGVAMPAKLRLGQRYRQEYDAGNAEDQAQVLFGRGQVQVPAGHFRQVRVTDESTPLEPRVDEMKFYARGVGIVMELGVSPGFSRSVLVKVRKG